ncbi:MAG: DDE-type integrase/transposase/recombinase, partial [Sphingomonadales bacterium]|nr:DDE-type integrase/transposase/recombinase [Sphingomonadales bacterium]
MVRKQDGSWRPCGDYRRLNNITQHDRYPLPNLQDFAANLHGCTIFSKIDLKKGYHQIPMAAGDIEKTAIVTPFGLYEYLRMPFGLKNAAQTFQRLMDHIFRDMPFVFIYLDDMIIASRTPAEHHQHLEDIFTVLQANGLVANTEKCAFGQPEVEFLGHQVSTAGLVPLRRHIDAIREFPAPSDVKGLQRFLGMFNFFRRFISSAAAILKPLTDVLAGNPKKLPWSPELQRAFEAAKTALAAAAPLAHPDPTAELALATDASDVHIGGVLQQRQGSSWAPLAFYSQKLSPTQQRYSTFDRELLAAFSAIRHFRFMLEGRRFQLQTDHRPLIAASERVSPPWSGRQQRQLAYISEFTADIKYVPGGDNVVADALSRPTSPSSASTPPQPPAATSAVLSTSSSAPQPPAVAGRAPVCSSTDQSPPTPVDFTDMAVRQLICPSVAEMKKSTSLQLATVPLVGVDLIGDTSTGSFRPLVPVPLRRLVFDSIHNAAHPGARATRRLVSARFVWPGLAKDVTTWSRTCLSCQRTKVQQHVHLPPEAIPVPDRRFAHLHVDLVGPLPPSGGFTYLFTIIDRATRWFEALPVATITAADCASALFTGWITRFGVPSSITSDRGAQFTSTLWSSLCKLLNIQHISTTAYHPQGNGLVERQHQRLKDALRARASGPAWIQDLPWVLLGMQA